MSMGHWWNDNDRRKAKTLGRNPFPGVTLTTKNDTWTVLRKNPDLHSDRPAPKPSCGKAQILRTNQTVVTQASQSLGPSER